MEDDIVFLGKPGHLNRFADDFDLETEERCHILDDLALSLDGAIIGVQRKRIEPFLEEPEIRKIRYGVIAMPKNAKLENEEDFFRLMAILVPLEETF